MELRRHVTRALHDDHMTTAGVLERLEALLGRHPIGAPPDTANPDIAKLLKDLGRMIEVEIGPHFAFEEECLFPRFAEAGDSEMGEFLLEEHRVILPLASRLMTCVKGAAGMGFTPDGWTEFHTTGAELVERLMSHIQKEEMGLLLALDDFLDEETDSTLALEFASRR